MRFLDIRCDDEEQSLVARGSPGDEHRERAATDSSERKPFPGRGRQGELRQGLETLGHAIDAIFSKEGKVNG